MAVLYNIYISSNPTGPWDLVNETPISDDSSGNQYTISDLVNGRLYYIMVVGGRLDSNGVFIPISGQPLGPGAEPGTSISNPNIVATRPKEVRYGG